LRKRGGEREKRRASTAVSFNYSSERGKEGKLSVLKRKRKKEREEKVNFSLILFLEERGKEKKNSIPCCA